MSISVPGRRSAVVWVWVVLLLCSAAPAVAQDVGRILGPLAPRVTLGTSNGITASVIGDIFLLANPANPNAIRYYSAPWEGDFAGGRSVGVTVSVNADAKHGAGLVYSFDEASRTYYTFVVHGDGRVGLYRRDGDGYRTIDVTKDAKARLDGTDRIEIVETGAKAELALNGTVEWDLDGAAVGKGTVGIVSVGAGTFGFKNFAFGPVAVGEAEPAGTDDTLPGTEPGPTPTPTPEPPMDPVLKARGDRLMGAILSVFFHEFGHAFVGELNLPAVGPEEDVADEFATMIFIDNFPDDPVTMKAVALGSATFWRNFAAKREAEGTMAPWFDEHAPDMIRFGKIMCLLHGAYPDEFREEAMASGFSEKRLETCKWEYPRKHSAWLRLMQPHRRAIDPRFPGDHPADAPGGKISVQYGAAQSPEGQLFGPAMQELALFDNVSALLGRAFVLPRDVTVFIQDCEVENAWYDPDAHTVTMCYQMMALQAKLLEAKPQQPGDRQPQPNGDERSAMMANLLVGMWEGRITVNGQAVFVRTSYNRDGTFVQQQTPQADNLTVRIDGRWSVKAMGGTAGSLSSTPLSWFPLEYCTASGVCHALNFQPVESPLTFLDENTIELQGTRLARVQ